MDLSDYAQPKTLPWKPMVLIAAATLVVIVVVVVVIRLVQNARQEEVFLQNGGSQTANALEQCESASDPDACREALLEDIAKQTGSVEMCEMLQEQEDRDNCYWGVARTTQDREVCEPISISEDIERCEDDILEALAIASLDVLLCEEMHDTARAGRCQQVVAGPLTSQNCDERNPELCVDIALFEQAAVSLNASECEGIVDEGWQLSCYDMVEDELAREPIDDPDTDGDGLTDTEEVTYGTDPENSDTDGDTYLDGDEVAAGYDPNGPGRLE